jgi:hypothetical protein
MDRLELWPIGEKPYVPDDRLLNYHLSTHKLPCGGRSPEKTVDQSRITITYFYNDYTRASDHGRLFFLCIDDERNIYHHSRYQISSKDN